MERVFGLVLLGIDMKAIIKMIYLKEKEFIIGMMEQYMKVIGNKIKKKDWELIILVTAINM